MDELLETREATRGKSRPQALAAGMPPPPPHPPASAARLTARELEDALDAGPAATAAAAAAPPSASTPSTTPSSSSTTTTTRTPDTASAARRQRPRVASLQETVLERPWGGSGDSCVVSRVLYALEEPAEGAAHQEPLPPRAVVVKRLMGASRRHAWDAVKQEIKTASYRVEARFLLDVSQPTPQTPPSGGAPSESTELPALARSLGFRAWGRDRSTLVLEDLVARGFPRHSADLAWEDVEAALVWLAGFHGFFMDHPRRASSVPCWRRGSYWALDKRLEELRRGKRRFREALRELERQGEGQGQGERVGLPRDLGARLVALAVPLQDALHPSARAEPPVPAAVDYDSDESDGPRFSRAFRGKAACVDALVVGSSRAPGAAAPGEEETASGGGRHAPRRSVLTPTLVHGDFKAENLFFRGSPPHVACAACDFQWVGHGLGVLDIVSLVWERPSPPTLEEERRIADVYLAALLGAGSAVPEEERALFAAALEVAFLDFARYVVGTGDVYLEDVPFLRRANDALQRVHHAAAASAERSRSASNPAQGRDAAASAADAFRRSAIQVDAERAALARPEPEARPHARTEGRHHRHAPREERRRSRSRSRSRSPELGGKRRSARRSPPVRALGAPPAPRGDGGKDAGAAHSARWAPRR